jgi:glycosyltransferase involved in cell wall biosynthesis
VVRRQSLAFVVPGSLETRTGGYEYDRRIIAGLRALGWSVETRELDGAFPRPTAPALAAAARVLAALPDGATVVIDGLALGAMPEQIESEACRLRIVALVHLPLGCEVGIDAETAMHLRAGERRAVVASRCVIITGRCTAAVVEAHGIARSRIVVIEPGTERAPLACGSQDGTLQLLCVATINQGKGHAILFRALASMTELRWRLTCAGSLTRDLATVQRLWDQRHADGLDDRIVLTGELDEPDLDALYDRADLFVLPTLHETYGMAVAEALARGVPVVSTRTGAIPDLVGDEAGILVTPGDEKAFTDGLRAVITDPGLRTRLAAGARRRRDRLPSWEDAARQMSELLGRVSG